LEPGLRAAALHHHRRGQLMATSAFRESYDGHDLIAPTSNALDFLGRATTSSTDYMGRALRRGVRVNSTPVVLGQELQFATGEKFVVTTGGTTAASARACRPSARASATELPRCLGSGDVHREKSR
jgi:hypothetical protein